MISTFVKIFVKILLFSCNCGKMIITFGVSKKIKVTVLYVAKVR